MPEQTPLEPRWDHQEAVRLTLKAWHIPVGTILVGGLALASVLSTVFTIVAYGPAGAIP